MEINPMKPSDTKDYLNSSYSQVKRIQEMVKPVLVLN